MKELDLLNYHKWASGQLLNHIIRLPESVFSTKLKGTFSSISETFAHIYDVDTLWFKRVNPEYEAKEVMMDNPITALMHFKELHEEMTEFFESNQVTEVIYLNSKGESFKNDINEIIRHLANHGTYHRGNIATMIRQLGYEAISTDYIYYLRNRNEKN